MSVTLHAEPTGLGSIRIWSSDEKGIRIMSSIPMIELSRRMYSWIKMPSAHGYTREEVDHIYSAMLLEATFTRAIGTFQ